MSTVFVVVVVSAATATAAAADASIVLTIYVYNYITKLIDGIICVCTTQNATRNAKTNVQKRQTHLSVF